MSIMTRILQRIRIALALIRKFGIHKMLTAHHESSNDSSFVLTDCPRCGTEHRVHKLRAARSMIKCTNCGARFVGTTAIVGESAFMKAFGRTKF